jgi:NAD(P)H-dependent flavin oxidoreductase YrpB (nitropropane dioxygenase family)
MAALALGAQGVLLGTRFLATAESPLHPNFKRAIVDSDGHDTQLSISRYCGWASLAGSDDAFAAQSFHRALGWAEWALRQARAEAIAKLRAARELGDVDEAPLSMGQDAGLIHDIPPAGEIVARIAKEAEEILTRGFSGYVVKGH